VAILVRSLIIILFLLVGQCNAFGQLPDIQHNYTKQDSTENPLINSFLKQYEFVIAYTEQSYWWSDRKHYKILTYSNKKWTSWTYSANSSQSTKNKRSKKNNIDSVRNNQFLKIKTEIQDQDASGLISDLHIGDFWTLNSDSLNLTSREEIDPTNGTTITRKGSISDGINYHFDILTKTDLRAIESYEPDYFIKKFPDMEDRKKFIISRDIFLKWWEKYCH
jgi:hypothetical protein